MRALIAVCLLIAPAAVAAASYETLARELVAPCCWKEALALHRSPAAEEARAELRRLVAEGKTDAQIREWFVGRYGERVLLTPSGDKGQALFWAPVLAGLAALIAGAAVLRKWTAHRTRSPAEYFAASGLDDSEWDW